MNTARVAGNGTVKVAWRKLIVSAHGPTAHLLLFLLAALLFVLWTTDPGRAGVLMLGLLVTRA